MQALKAGALSADRPAFDLPAGSTVWITDDENGLSAALAKDLSGRGFKPEIVRLEMGGLCVDCQKK